MQSLVSTETTSSSSGLDGVVYCFQPLVNLVTGRVVAVELRAEVRQEPAVNMLTAAATTELLTRLDAGLAAGAVRYSAEYPTPLPVHINLLADTVGGESNRLEELHEVILANGREPSTVTVEIGPAWLDVEPERVVVGAGRLRDWGYRIALDEVGLYDLPLALIADILPDLVKLDGEVVVGLTEHRRCAAVAADAVARLCESMGARLAAEGVDDQVQLVALREHGVGLAQGPLLASPTRRPVTRLPVPLPVGPIKAPSASARSRGSIAEVLQPAVTLPATATAGQVRDVLRDVPDVTTVVLVDGGGRAVGSLDRNRFMLAMSGRFGHALHANRSADLLSDPPRLLSVDVDPQPAMEKADHSDPQRMYDDFVVVDSTGRCIGVAKVGDLLRGVAERSIAHAAALHPVTGLPGTASAGAVIDERCAAQRSFAVTWIAMADATEGQHTVDLLAHEAALAATGTRVTSGAAGLRSTHVAHVGTDSFVVITKLEDMMPLGNAVLGQSPAVPDRAVVLSLTSLRCVSGSAAGQHEVFRRLASLRRRAKKLTAPSWLTGCLGTEQVDILRDGSGILKLQQPAT